MELLKVDDLEEALSKLTREAEKITIETEAVSYTHLDVYKRQEVACEGDTYVDDHHSVEDIGICLGTAFRRALDDMAGINRYGSIIPVSYTHLDVYKRQK